MKPNNVEKSYRAFKMYPMSKVKNYLTGNKKDDRFTDDPKKAQIFPGMTAVVVALRKARKEDPGVVYQFEEAKKSTPVKAKKPKPPKKKKV